MNYGTRCYRFEIARKYRAQSLGDIKFGFCESTEYDAYEGKNCRLLVEIAGTMDPKTEMVMDLGDLDAIVDEILLSYDHTTITYTFRELTEFLWYRIRGACNLVHSITLHEDDKYYYEKSDRGSMDRTRTYTFSAAHKTENKKLSDEENKKIYGKCNNLHGHQYRLEVTWRIPDKLEEKDNYIDRIDNDVRHAMFKYGNGILNDVLELPSGNATTELFVRELWKDFTSDLEYDDENPHGITLHRLRLHETDRNYFDYYGDC